MENYIDQLAKSYERLRDLKVQQKEYRADFKSACEGNPQFIVLTEQKKELSEELKAIKDATLYGTPIKADMDECKESIALEQEIIAGCIEKLIANGTVHAGEEFDAGIFTFIPKIRVHLSAQLKLL